ncbi:tetraspanin-1-like [Pieris napi]|uniref:tetraspanin-1-like n=1 Tax=Pieris napi TaxID=78633 RepID=UPI001FB9221A|nr:tetraspanin-1-like [Pieris napi]
MHSTGLPRTCLGFTNLLFFIFGSVGLLICVWCAINTEFFKDVNYTITKSSFVSSIANFVNLKLWLTPMTTILIPIAGLAMLTSCCGLLGAGCRTKCAIKSYIFLVTALSLSTFWLFFVFGVHNIYTDNAKTRNYLRSTLKTYYGNENDFITHMWDYVMVEYKCCGVNNYKDFVDSAWQRNNMDKLYPIHCCVMDKNFVPVSKACTQTLDVQAYAHIGCFDALRQSIKDNKGLIIFYIFLLLISYTAVIFFAFCIIRGEPLLGIVEPVSFIPKHIDNVENITRNSSLDNMMFVEEPPKKVVRVVSAINPAQTYKFTPNMYSGSYPQTIRSHTLQ